MRTKEPHYVAIGIICAFFILVLGFSFAFKMHYPVLVIAGESSVGTWMSGALLIASAVLSIVIGIKRGWYPWFLFVVFFFILALDERFMFHEQIKERMIFNMVPVSAAWHWIFELPAILGALAGSIIASILWRNLNDTGKVLLLCAVSLGCVSVIIDILCVSVFIEDLCKLLAELSITCALVGEV